MSETTIITGFNLIVFVVFVVALVFYAGYNFADVEVQMGQTFRQIEAKHIAHLAESCLEGGKEYIDLATANLEKCMFGADLLKVTDAVNPKNKKEKGWDIVGNRNHRIAVNIKDGDEIHPGWLYVEF